MKIAILADFPLTALTGDTSGRGGGQGCTWLPQIALAWQSAVEFDIHWLVFDRHAAKHESLRKWNQTFHRIPCTSISASLLLGRWPHRLATRRLLDTLRPDLIHCWGTENLNGAPLLDFRGPSILSMQGIIRTYFKTGDLRGWRWRLFRHWERTSIHEASVITSESQWGLNRVTEMNPNAMLRKVEYGVHPSYYNIQWQPEPDHPRVLFIGGFNRLKGVDIMIEMLTKHPERSWKIAFAGGGYLMEAIKKLDNPSVEILGLLTTEQVQKEMAKSWALIMPSRADTSPNVVKEARVIGLPVIGSPHGGHAEYITHELDGLLVSSEDPTAWYRAIDSLCGDFKRCVAMGSANHTLFREHFRPEKTASSFLYLYREMLS